MRLFFLDIFLFSFSKYCDGVPRSAEKSGAELPLRAFSVLRCAAERILFSPPLSQPYHLQSAAEYARRKAGNFLKEKSERPAGEAKQEKGISAKLRFSLVY